MSIAQQKTPLRFLTFSIGLSRWLVITWQHKYQVHPTDSLNICHLITILVPSSSIQSRRMISNMRFSLFLKTKLMASTLVRFVFYPVPSISYLVRSQTYLISVQKGLNPLYRIFLNFAKSCISSCSSKFYNKKKFHRAVFVT